MARQEGTHPVAAQGLANELAGLAERERETRLHTALRKRALFLDGFPGALVPAATGTPPAGWLRCDGQAVSRTQFAALFAAVGTAYGAGDGSTTFNVPNLNGNRFPRGNATPGGAGGSATHTHVGTTGVEQDGSLRQDGASGTFAIRTGHTHNFSTPAADNLPPYENVVWFVKT